MKQTYFVQTTDDSVPASTAGTGTFSSSGVVVTGTGTNFTLLKEGDYLINETASNIQEVERVISDTSLRLKEAFSANASGEDFKYIKRVFCKLTNLSIAAGEGEDTAVDGVTLIQGNSLNYEVAQADKDRGKRFLKPKYIQGATVGSATILTQSF
jgi:hypothetical protein